MARSYTASTLVSLPRTGAHDAIQLALAVEAAAIDDPATARRVHLSMPVDMSLDDVVTARNALETATAAHAFAPPTPEEREADRMEDAAVSALHDVLAGWSRLAGAVPEGDTAAAMYRLLFGEEGLGFTQLAIRRELAIMTAKLHLIEANLEPLSTLGAAPLVAHLRAVHRKYASVIGAHAEQAAVEPPPVRDRREALVEALRNYVLQVTASVADRGQPATQELADRLLRPIVEWDAQSTGSDGAGELYESA